ncbi:uncharacterized protein FIBRA_03560 [Fibroporia radiculosa]|uniref:Uncharacterized protein n=1 Tax=Fibroporia radiculosa TaxID=599839 RepID=J4H2G9_9APHY|nr:uncharacterized protein FIBRA_03560 [Fibroporia radiculosa]CCM01504.1 predicted protein [Fibroporia radiculosa]
MKDRNTDPTIPGGFIKTKVTGSVEPVTAFVVDIYITATLTWLLRKETSGYKS